MHVPQHVYVTSRSYPSSTFLVVLVVDDVVDDHLPIIGSNDLVQRPTSNGAFLPKESSATLLAVSFLLFFSFRSEGW